MRAIVCDMENPQDNVDRFRAIFDLCDEDKDGYIDVDHFKELAKDHFGAEGLDLEVRVRSAYRWFACDNVLTCHVNARLLLLLLLTSVNTAFTPYQCEFV